MNKLWFKDKQWWLLENWPEDLDLHPDQLDANAHPEFAEQIISADKFYHTLIDSSKSNPIRVANPELCHTWGTHGLLFTLDGKQIKEGDIFDFPEGLTYEKKMISYPFETARVDLTDWTAILSRLEEPKIDPLPTTAGTGTKNEELTIPFIVDKILPQIHKNGNMQYTTLEIKRIALTQYIAEYASQFTTPDKQEDKPDIVMVFDSYEWDKTGDVGDNSQFYRPAKVLRYRTHENELIVDVMFDDGRESNGHFFKCVVPVKQDVAGMSLEILKDCWKAACTWERGNELSLHTALDNDKPNFEQWIKIKNMGDIMLIGIGDDMEEQESIKHDPNLKHSQKLEMYRKYSKDALIDMIIDANMVVPERETCTTCGRPKNKCHRG